MATKWYIEVYDSHNILVVIGDWDSMGQASDWVINHVLPDRYSITYRAKATPEEAIRTFGDWDPK